ncbi:MAG: phosphoenolpyruvate--protein phosphotransferase [Oscillospiraceae bacterium]
MKILKGKAVSQGIAFGRLHLYKKDEQLTDENIIMLSEQLPSPEEIEKLNKKPVAFCAFKGSEHSHLTITSKNTGIPVLISLGEITAEDYEYCIVDAYSGELILSPDNITISQLKEKKAMAEKRQLQLKSYIGKKSITKSGKEIKVYSAVNRLADIKSAIANDAEGIGLFRSEYLYLESSEYPSEELLFQTYKRLAEKMEQKPVTIRAVDLGNDKSAEYMSFKSEENPALGNRGIRFCLKYPRIFKTQLRAILRAACYGNIRLLLPMITSAEEIDNAQKIMNEAACELSAQQIPFKIPPLGAMIETPAAALISHKIADKVDFISIGSNDLAQYTYAADRQHSDLQKYIDKDISPLMELIKTTIKNSAEKGVNVAICGFIAEDLNFTENLIEMGINEFSVSPQYTLPLRERISKC